MLVDPETDLLRLATSEAAPAPLRAIVAIPVCNEAERIGACLRALDRQVDVPANRLGIVLFLNNCTDGTGAVVAGLAAHSPHRVRVVERTFAGASAGWARREAMEAAADWLEEAGARDGAILTTDADSRVAEDWVARNLAALAGGADAVAGRIVLDPEDAARLPDALHARGRLESAYEALLTEIGARLDPDPHDPWPCHWTASGATLAVRLAAYRAVGGMPALPLGEDRAFVAYLRARNARVRHAPDITIVTSGRLEGRAQGGAADTMRLRCAMPECPCDERLETLPRAVFRYAWRRRIRRLHARGRLARTGLWAPLLGIARDAAREIAGLPSLGQALAAIEAASPRLDYHPLTPRQLVPQIARARVLVAVLRALARARDAVEAALPRGAGRASDADGGPAAETVRHG